MQRLAYHGEKSEVINASGVLNWINIQINEIVSEEELRSLKDNLKLLHGENRLAWLKKNCTRGQT